VPISPHKSAGKLIYHRPIKTDLRIQATDDWFYDPARRGGVLIDTIIHTFDLYRWYMGEVSSIFAIGGAFVLEGAKKYQTPDNVMCSFRFQNGAIGELYGT
jgi:predicted dehydrogenase